VNNETLVTIFLCSGCREISPAPGAAKMGRAGEGWVLPGSARVTHTEARKQTLLFIHDITQGRENQP